jgi:hypothetical protein
MTASWTIGQGRKRSLKCDRASLGCDKAWFSQNA